MAIKKAKQTESNSYINKIGRLFDNQPNQQNNAFEHDLCDSKKNFGSVVVAHQFFDAIFVFFVEITTHMTFFVLALNESRTKKTAEIFF